MTVTLARKGEGPLSGITDIQGSTFGTYRMILGYMQRMNGDGWRGDHVIAINRLLIYIWDVPNTDFWTRHY